MKVKQTISVVSRHVETSEERFKRITTIKMNVRDCILLNPEYDVVDVFIETEYTTDEASPETLVIGRL